MEPTAKEMTKAVDDLKESFEEYRDKVQVLEDTCATYELLSKRLAEENKIYRDFLKELKVLADKNKAVKIINMINGLDL